MALIADSRHSPYPSTRDSGLPWLGHIPAHWEVKRLKHVANVMFSSVDKHTVEGERPVYLCNYVDVYKNERITSDFEFMRASASAEEIRKFTLKKDDVMITKDSESWNDIAIPAYVPTDLENVLCGYHLALLRPKLAVDGKFLFRALQARPINYQFEVEATGITRYGIDQYAIGSTFFLLPPLPEQRTIAAFLDRQTAKIDALIAKKQRLLDLLAEQRAALISQAVTKGLNPDVKMKDSGVAWLGQVPEHWEVLPLKHAVENRPGAIKTGPFGSQLLSSEMLEGEIKVYNQRNVIDRDFVSGENYICKEKYKDLFSFTTYPGDVLLTTRGTIGRCAILPQNAEPGILHPCLMRIQPHRRKLLAEYLVLLIQDSFLLQTQLFLLSNATTIDVIYSDTMKRMIIPLPSLSEQREIIDYIKEEAGKIDALIEKVKSAIERLREYRSALISSAVTGKIKVEGLP
jgi:type I restriction enzyme S subunit